MSIKPVLLYYSVMSLALAEVLWKGTGDTSLDVLRSEHRHHGLIFSIDTNLSKYSLEEALTKISAKPLIKDRKWVGTFEVWHKNARQLPMVGRFESSKDHRIKSYGYSAILAETDERMPLIEKSGLTFINSIKYIPEMQNLLRQYNVETGACRAWLSRHYESDLDRRSGTLNHLNHVNIQPEKKEYVAKIIERVKCSASAVNAIDLIDLGDSAQITENVKVRNTISYWVDYPLGINRTAKELYLLPETPSVNEFGMFYASLFMLGNLCRYYPDIWMKILEDDHPLATVSASLMELAFKRVPVLALSELDENCIVEED